MKIVVEGKTFNNMEEAQAYAKEVEKREQEKEKLNEKKNKELQEIKDLSKAVEDKVKEYFKKYGEYPNGMIELKFSDDGEDVFDNDSIKDLFNELDLFKAPHRWTNFLK